MKNRKKEKGITLVALVVTIIVLIILAGISIRLVLGDNGIVTKAKQGKANYTEAQIAEQEMLEEWEKQIGGLPENTSDTEAGTEVRFPSNWSSTKPAKISTDDGSIVQRMIRVASVTAVATGNGETVPVPEGFYYVGGKINSGVVISDDQRDQNKYAGIEDVPAGVKYNEDGTVKTYTEEEYKKLSTEEKKEILLGNQFVWIPVSREEYTKTKWEKVNGAFETQARTSELTQIQKYGGFYIGRYEAGTSNISLSTGVSFENQNTGINWSNDSFSIRDELNHTLTGKITTKAGEVPYHHADYVTALKLSNSMYQTEYVQSGLVTGTMWDVMMKFIAGSNEEVVTSSSWGNYTNGNVTYTAGQGRYAIANTNNSSFDSPFTKADGAYHYGIKTTAISEDTKKKNLYDVAGNLWEWTEEAAYLNSSEETYMIRGGCYGSNFTNAPACYRTYSGVTSTNLDHGFRPALYIK